MKRLKQWLKQHGYTLSDDATDATVEATAVEAIGDGELSLTKYAELTADQSVRAARKEFAREVAAAIRGESIDDDDGFDIPLASDKQIESLTRQMVNRHSIGNVASQEQFENVMKMASGRHAGSDGDFVSLRVKGVEERFSTKRYAGKHARTGEPMFHKEQQVETSSELDRAKSAVFIKFVARKAGVPTSSLTDTEQALLQSMLEEPWIAQHSDRTELMPGKAVKTALTGVLGDTGAALVPESYDRRLVHEMLLQGELFPFCNIIDIPHGQSIELGRMGTPTVTWGPRDDNALSPFDPTSLLTAVSADVEDVAVAIEVGNFLMADSVIPFANDLQSAMVNAMTADLDRVVAVGATGSNEPEGLLNASGTLDIPAANGASGPLTDGDFLNLTFGLPKTLDSNARLVMTKTSYQRFRSLVTGVTGDDRRLYKDDLKSYRIDGVPVSIFEPNVAGGGRGQGGLTNAQLIYVNLQKYRIWRRQGLTFIADNTGRTNRLNNTTLFLAMLRVAGKLIDPFACAKIDDAQT